MADVASILQQAQQTLNKRQFQQARELFMQVIEQKPGHPDGHYGLGTACFLQGDFLGAAHHFKEVTRHDPLRAGAFINLGAIYNRLGRYEEAITTLRRGIQLDPQRGEGYYNLGLVYRHTEQWNLALDAYREAVRINPKMPEAHFNLANLLLELEKYYAAIVHYRQALKYRPDWPEAKQGLEMAEEGSAEAQASHATDPMAPVAPVPTPGGVQGARPDHGDVDAADAEGAEPPRLDPKLHGELLTELHSLTKIAESLGHELGDDVGKSLEGAIKDLSAMLIRPDAPMHEFTRVLEHFQKVTRRFDSMRKKLEDLKTKFHEQREAFKAF